METKPLLYGLIGFFLGGFIVSVAATTFDKPNTGSMSMTGMTKELENKTGDEYDAAFISSMIEHHESAVDMARLSAERAKHPEIKTLSSEIIRTQQAEIDQMKQWWTAWKYAEVDKTGSHSSH